MLTIYDNNLEGQLSPSVCKLERLHTLHLSFNKISGPLPDALGDAPALQVLRLDHNLRSGTVPAGLAEHLTVFGVSPQSGLGGAIAPN
jgi:Leucine-rich repeat (LRR) protein